MKQLAISIIRSFDSKRLIEALPMIVSLYGLWILFDVIDALTSNTGNILAWGFKGLSSLGKSGWGLFVYEFVHTTTAYRFTLAGLWCVALAAVTLFLFGRIRPSSARILLLTICGCGLATFLVFNLTLMIYPNPSFLLKYLEMLTTNPFEGKSIALKPSDRWMLCFPTIVSAIFLFPTWWRIPGWWHPITITLPLVVAPLVTINYLSYHFLCFSDPEIYAEILRPMSWALLCAPSVVFLFLVFRRRSTQKR